MCSRHILWSFSMLLQMTGAQRLFMWGLYFRAAELWLWQKLFVKRKKDLWAQRIKSRKSLSIPYWAKPRRLVQSNLPLWGRGDWLHWGPHYSANPPQRSNGPLTLTLLISHLEENVGSQLIRNLFLGLCSHIKSQIDMCNHMKAHPVVGLSWSSRAAGVFCFVLFCVQYVWFGRLRGGWCICKWNPSCIISLKCLETGWEDMYIWKCTYSQPALIQFTYDIYISGVFIRSGHT